VKLAVGYELIYQLPQPTPMILALHVHESRLPDLLTPDILSTDPVVPLAFYRDSFRNWCTRLEAPAGRFKITGGATVADAGLPDPVVPAAVQHPVPDLPAETLLYLLGSRYCETDELSPIAWRLFGHTPPGWARVQAVCDFVHAHIKFDYQQARPTRTALHTYQEGVGVCRDYAHLALAFCRCLNIPARYCTGYLSDVGVAVPVIPMDFSGWFEAYLGGEWRMFDPRSNRPRIGRVLMATGRDATDVAITNTFGPNVLEKFTVWTYELF
jgi:transglutaminase-like putative cysteine protease